MNRLTCTQARSLIAVDDDDVRPDSDSLRRHLAVCDACAAAAPELSLLFTLTPETSPRERFRPRVRGSGLAAAALVIAAAVGVLGKMTTDDDAPAILDVGMTTAGGSVLVEDDGAATATHAQASVTRSVHGAGVESVLTFEVSSEPARGRGRPAMEWVR